MGGAPSERDPETSSVTSTHLVNKQVFTSKQGRKAESNDKVLLYSTGNYIQHPVINHNGKEHIEKEGICMHDRITFLYSRN